MVARVACWVPWIAAVWFSQPLEHARCDPKLCASAPIEAIESLSMHTFDAPPTLIAIRRKYDRAPLSAASVQAINSAIAADDLPAIKRLIKELGAPAISYLDDTCKAPGDRGIVAARLLTGWRAATGGRLSVGAPFP